MTQKSNYCFFNERKLSHTTQKTTPLTKPMFIILTIIGVKIIYLKYYRPENNRSYSYVLLVIDSLSKCGWTVLLINQKAQLIKDSFGKKFTTSERIPKLFESDNGK